MADVFISYAKEDQDTAEKFATILKSEGFDIWWDKHLIPEGDLDSIIRRELNECKVVIVIWSEASAASPWVTGEATTAQDMEKLVSTCVPALPHDRIPIRFRGMATVSIDHIEKIISEIQRRNVRRSSYDARLKELLLESSERDIFSNVATSDNENSIEWHDPIHFSRLIIRLAIRDFSFPIETESESFTEGLYDLGMDGFSVSIGGFTISDPEQAAACVEANPDEPLRILLVQTKLNQHIRDQDVAFFGSKAQQIVTLSEASLLKLRPNAQILNRWKCFDAARSKIISMGKPFAPEIYLVFAYAGEWRNFAGPGTQLEQVSTNLRGAVPLGRITYEVWGVNEIALAATRSGPSIKKILTSVQLTRLPTNSTVAGYIGFVKAAELVDCFSRTSAGHKSLDVQFFAENPRSFLSLEDRSDNLGALGLQSAIREGRGADVVLGHNGVVIVAKHANFVDEQSIELIGPQIVNGCQSCFTIESNLQHAGDVYLPLRLILSPSGDVVDEAIRASNTQAQIDNYDMLSRLPGVRHLQRPFEAGPTDAIDRLWFQRRRNDWLGAGFGGWAWDRVLTPRQLFEAYYAVIEGAPHAVQAQAKAQLNKALAGEVFRADHEPNLYRALGWLIVCARRWVKRTEQKRWDDRFYYGGSGVYPARNQFIFALFQIADSNPDQLTDSDITIGRAAQDRFQRTVLALAMDQDPARYGPKSRLSDLAAQALEEARSGQTLTAELSRRSDFTSRIKAAASKLRR